MNLIDGQKYWYLYLIYNLVLNLITLPSFIFGVVKLISELRQKVIDMLKVFNFLTFVLFCCWLYFITIMIYAVPGRTFTWTRFGSLVSGNLIAFQLVNILTWTDVTIHMKFYK